MFKRILACLLTLSIILSMSTAVFAVDTEITCSSISFTDLSGNPVTEISLAPIIAKTTIVANPTGQKPVLLVCHYDGGMLKEIWHKTADALTGDISLQFTPASAAGEIKATLLNDLKTLNYSLASAKLAEDNTNLSLVMVNGEVFEEYSDGTNVYAMKVSEDSEIKIDAIPADGGTKVEVENISTLPGVAKIKIESASGIKRTVEFVVYSDEKQLSTPKNLAYKIGETSYDIEGFDAAATEYTVELPDNTFFVQVNPEVLGVTETDVMVLDVDPSKKTYGGVSYVSGSLASYYSMWFSKRPAVNNIIPIKNEETKAVITTSYGSSSETYTVTFKSRQPRLTEFNISDAAKADKYYPIFIGGAAAFNDNGSPAGTDRAWAVVNISDNLIGSSMFAMHLAANRKGGSNDWLETNTTGEYFNFTADTSGTLYLLTNDTFTNAEYNIQSGEFARDGQWRLISSYNGAVPSGYTNWDLVPRTFANYGDNIYYARKIEYQGMDKFAADALTSNVSSFGKEYYYNAYARTFEAGESVSVYHKGTSSPIIMGFIKWELEEENTISETSLYSEEEFYGEENAEYNQISLFRENVAEFYSETVDVVTVGGTVEPYSKVSFMLLDSSSMGCDSEDDTFNAYKSMVDQNETLTTSEVFFYENVIAGADGKWSYTIPMTDIETKNLTLVTNTGEVEYIQYASTEYKTNILPNIVEKAKVDDDGTALANEITKYAPYISDKAKQYNKLDTANKLKVAQYNKAMIAGLNPDDSAELTKLKTGLDSTVVIFGVKQGIITEFDEVMSIVSYDTEEKSNISDAGKKKLVTLLKNDEYISITDYQEKAKVQFALQHFNYNVNQSSDKLLGVLEENNSILNLDLSKLYLLEESNQPRAAKELAEKLSESVAAAQTNLDDIAGELKKKENDGSGGGGGGGGTGPSTTINENKVHNASGSQSISNEYLEAKKYIYSDMKDASWAADAVLYLNKEGIVSGYEDGTFKPLNPITRAEFTKLIVSTFFKNKEFEFSGNFKDIDSNEWYAEYVNIAYNMGVVSGDEKGYFNPNDTISREDMAVIIYNAGMKFNLFENVEEYSKFSDDSSISDYAKTAVYTLKNKSVVNGVGDGLFAPKANADRASAAKILYELIIESVE